MRRLRELAVGERGATLVQWMLVLPIFLMIVVGGYEIWRAQSVRESLRSGTYEATRYLSFNPNESNWIGVVRDDFVVPELINNNLVMPEMANEVIIIASPPALECGETFTIRTEMPWRAVIPFISQEDWMIRVQFEGEVICL
jgi:hypothetical protein